MKRFILIISLIAFPLISHADPGWYGDNRGHHYSGHFWNNVNRRLDRQSHRIQQGVEHGELTWREARKLRREQYRITKRIDPIRHKYRLTHYDKRRVMSYLDKASDNIHRLKHNDRIAHRDHRPGHHVPHRGNQVAWSDVQRSIGFFIRY